MSLIDSGVHKGSQYGFSLIEVLVALLVFLVGLVGLATLIVNGIKFSDGANLRSQAVVLAYDMADKIRANGNAAGDYTTALTDNPAANPPNCTSSVCTPTDIAQADVAAWLRSLGQRLPAGDGFNQLAGSRMTITVQWNDRGVSQQYQLVVQL